MAIVPEYLRSHLWKNHKIFCSSETQRALIRSHSLRSLDDILDFRQATTVLEVPIDGIPILNGYRCLHCDHSTVQPEAMRRHVQSHSQDGEDTLCTEKCKVQWPFGGRWKKCFGLVDRAATVIVEDNDSAWNVVSGMLKRKRARLSTEKEENLRFINSFVARTRWDILAEDHDWKKLK